MNFVHVEAELRIFRAAFDHLDVDKSGEMDAQGKMDEKV
jgi:hypothetical protein